MVDPLADSRRFGSKPMAVHDSLRILEEVARCGPGVTAKEITTNLSLPRATAYRLLNLLVQEEYLVRLSDLRGFALGVRVRHLVAPRLVHLSRAVREVMEELRSHSRAGIHLATFGRSGVEAIDIDPDFPLHGHDAIFRRSAATALGLLLDSYRYPDRMSSGTHPQARCQDGRPWSSGSPGFAIQLGKLRSGFGCLAVPIFVDGAPLPAAAIALSSTIRRVQEAAADLTMLQSKARQLEHLL